MFIIDYYYVQFDSFHSGKKLFPANIERTNRHFEGGRANT